MAIMFYNLREYSDSISYELISVPYDLEKELFSKSENIEKDAYEEEIRNGKYRDMEKLNKSFELRGIDVEKI